MTDQAVTVGNILEFFETWAASHTAEDWDHVGLQVGSMQTPVKKVMTALDITPSVVTQAAAMNVNLIVSHHPVIFRPLSHLNESQASYWLARHGISSIAMHTNMDKAAGGVNDSLAAQMGLSQVRVAEDGYCRIGTLLEPLSPYDFAAWTAQCLHVPDGGIQWINGGNSIQTVAVCGGAGGDFLAGITPLADAFVTGELHYHEWPASSDMTILTAGHYHTERGIMFSMAYRLQKQFPALTVTVADENCPYESWSR